MAKASGQKLHAVATTRHPLYDQFQREWFDLRHVREGTGGFMDGTYLVGHPREYQDHTTIVSERDMVTNQVIQRAASNPNPTKPTAKLLARRKIARYENLASAILDAKKAALFRRPPTRRVGQQAPSEERRSNV